MLISIIKSTNAFFKDIQINLLGKAGKKWKQVLQVKNIYTCTKEIYLDQIHKRSIQKYLHCLALDKMIIKILSEGYKNYLHGKWEKIIVYTKPYHGTLYNKI